MMGPITYYLYEQSIYIESSSGLGDDEPHMCRLELKVDLNFFCYGNGFGSRISLVLIVLKFKQLSKVVGNILEWKTFLNTALVLLVEVSM